MSVGALMGLGVVCLALQTGDGVEALHGDIDVHTLKAAETPIEQGYDLNSDIPPPRVPTQGPHGKVLAGQLGGERRSALEQVGRTILSLAFVVLLIYVAGRFAKSKLGSMRMPVKSGEYIKVQERVTIDAQRVLFLVQVQVSGTKQDGDAGSFRQLLLGTGEKGVHLVADLGEGTAEHVKAEFSSLLEKKNNIEPTEATGEGNART